ncbi:MAG: redoxin family protein [Bdellovibrionaceae bacterium]|nr:redoxin family protein [Pseudobdellovibrionaceae bacterium]
MSKLIFVMLMIGAIRAFSAVDLGKVSGFDLVSGQVVTKNSQGKKALVIIFLSSVCPCSNSHVSELKSLSQEYPEFSFVAMHSNSEEDEDDAKKYFTSLDLNFPVIQDKNAEFADLYKALKTPHVFVVSPEGKVIYQGGVSNSRQLAQADRKYLREALGEINNGKPVSSPKTRTLGCVISRGETHAR